ncbi:MAG: hypothetical protein LBC34_02065 [Rickettsiales bacterium]|nr:hypothetical protein [Rickettsiales bacterium]
MLLCQCFNVGAIYIADNVMQVDDTGMTPFVVNSLLLYDHLFRASCLSHFTIPLNGYGKTNVVGRVNQ